MGRPRIWASDAERKAASREAARASEGRAAAIEQGRLLGADTARSLREDTHQSAQRTARAMAYAAWEFDGKPDGWDAYVKEFGVAASPGVMNSFDRPVVQIVP